MKAPSRLRPLARRRWFRERAKADARWKAEKFMMDLYLLGEHRGDHRFPLGTITRDGYQGGMDPDLARLLGRDP